MKACPRCGRFMVEKQSDVIYLTNPPQYDLTWWCGCGYQEFAGRVYEESSEQRLKEEWEKINK